MHKRESLWQSEENFFSAEHYFNALIQDLDAAQNCILMESYIFELDALGKQVVDSLARAKNRGVNIKVLVDGIGSMNTMDELIETFHQHDLPLKVYHPLPWSFNSYQHAVRKGGFIDKLLHFTGRINHRDHRKLCIIDNQIAWAGSYNICVIHLPPHLGGENWKDHGFRVTGENVAHLGAEFLNIWNDDSVEKPLRSSLRSLPFALSTLNPIKRRQRLQRILRSIETAKKRIWIANAYFAPHHSITKALIQAKRKGVDIRILVGGKSDIIFFPSLTRSFYADLLNTRMEIHEWQHSVLHSKIALIDDFCFSGSSNLNSRSHFHDLELDILLCHENTIHEIEQKMLEDFFESKQIFPKEVSASAFSIFINALIPRLLRYWL